jgi:hypothetical protein
MRPVYHVASALVAEAQFEALGKQLDRTHTAASLRSLAESLTVLRRGLAPKLAPDPHSTACPPPPLSLTDPDLVRRRARAGGQSAFAVDRPWAGSPSATTPYMSPRARDTALGCHPTNNVPGDVEPPPTFCRMRAEQRHCDRGLVPIGGLARRCPHQGGQPGSWAAIRSSRRLVSAARPAALVTARARANAAAASVARVGSQVAAASPLSAKARACSAATFRSARASSVSAAVSASLKPAPHRRSVQLKQGQCLQEQQRQLLGRVGPLPPRGRRGQRRSRITRQEIDPRQPRPRHSRRFDVASRISNTHRLIEQRHRLLCVARGSARPDPDRSTHSPRCTGRRCVG